jgi:pyruvate kinase
MLCAVCGLYAGFIQQVLDDAGASGIKIICKIESQAGLINFDDILAVADGIMVARGDLAMGGGEPGCGAKGGGRMA